MALDEMTRSAWRECEPEAIGLDRKALAAMARTIRRERYPIDSITVARRARVGFDVAFHPFRRGAPHRLYSCTKTVVGMLVGAAAQRGLIGDVRAPLASFLPEHADRLRGARGRITLEHVLTMSWGLQTPDGGDRWVGFEDDDGRGLLSRILAAPLVTPPGETFVYNNSCSHVLCSVLQRATGQTPLAFAREALLEPLGIGEVEWDADAEAGNTGWSGLRLSARDTAKLGQLFLNRGEWGRRRLLPADWIQQSTRAHLPAAPHGGYGYHWWIADGYYMAAGIFGQFLFVVPDRDLVVVINSTLRSGDTNLPRSLMERFVLGPLQGAQPTAAKVVRGSRSYHAQRFVWRSEAEGVCEDGRFVRQASPAFSFRCPPRARKANLIAANQVAALKTADDFPFYASVAAQPEGLGLEAAGPHFAGLIGSPGISDVRVTANRAIELPGARPGYRTELAYRWQPDVAMKAVVVSAFVDGRWVFLDGHTPLDVGELGRVAESLTIAA